MLIKIPLLGEIETTDGSCIKSSFGFMSFWASLIARLVKNVPANAGDTRDVGSIPGLGRPPGVGNGTPLQYCCLGNPTDREFWLATVYGVAKSQPRLSTWAQPISLEPETGESGMVSVLPPSGFPVCTRCDSESVLSKCVFHIWLTRHSLKHLWRNMLPVKLPRTSKDRTTVANDKITAAFSHTSRESRVVFLESNLAIGVQT